MAEGEMVNEGDFAEACEFVIRVGRSAHQYGSSASRIESYLAHLTTSLGYRGTFRATPTEILFAFRKDASSPQQLKLEDVPPSGWNLNRLAALGSLAGAVETRQISIPQATQRLDEVAKAPDPWGPAVAAISFVIAGAGFATMIGGSAWDMVAGGVLGLVAFLTMVLIERFGGARAGDWLPFVVALVTGVLVACARVVQPDINPIVASVCAVIILVPGYAVSVGVLELLTNHVVSGMANLMNGLLTLAKLVGGAWLGYALVTLAVSVPPVAPGEAVGIAWLLAALVPMLAALCFAFQTPRADVPMTIAIVGIAFIVMFLTGAAVPAMAGVLVGTLLSAAVGVVLANVWNRRTRRPASIMTAPLAMLLVSGSIGFRGLATITTGQADLGLEQFLQMFLVAIAIGVGLLVGNSIVRPRPSL